ncbi:smalltalk protein [Segatella albensis]|nr:smalltalk protein [Segatella albensis]
MSLESKRQTWAEIIRFVITVLSAIIGSWGVASCKAI